MDFSMIPRSFATHDGSFHADEVTACALLLLFDQIDREYIVRTRDYSKLTECDFVCDVGGIYDPQKRRFDHHQLEYKGELSSAGMIWLYFKEENIIDPDTYEFFNRSLIRGVDAHDNGKFNIEPGICSFSQIISNFVPPMYDASDHVLDAAFYEAVDFTLGHLKRLLQRWQYTKSCQAAVAQAMEERKLVLYFQEAMPWMDSFFEMGGENHPALFVVMPSRGHWKLRGIPPSSNDRMKVRKPLPLEWAGLLDLDLQRASGIPGAIFCHKGRFISVWETKEDVEKAIDYIFKND